MARRALVSVALRLCSGGVLVTVLLPMLLVVAVVSDALRRVASGMPPTAVRLVAFLWVYLAAEVAGIALLATAVARRTTSPARARSSRGRRAAADAFADTGRPHPAGARAS